MRNIICILLAVMAAGLVACAAAEEAAVTETGDDPFYILPITDELFARIWGKSFKEDCTLPREDLRYLHVLHKDLDGNEHEGVTVGIFVFGIFAFSVLTVGIFTLDVLTFVVLAVFILVFVVVILKTESRGILSLGLGLDIDLEARELGGKPCVLSFLTDRE